MKNLLLMVMSLGVVLCCGCSNYTKDMQASSEEKNAYENSIDTSSSSNTLYDAQFSDINSNETEINNEQKDLSQTYSAGTFSASAHEKTNAPNSAQNSNIQTELSPNEIESEMLYYINDLRRSAEAEVLEENDDINWAAKIRAEEVLEKMSHTRPNGEEYYTVFDETGYQYAGKWHGENLSCISFVNGALGSKQIAKKMFEGLKNSAGHYNNMVSANYDLVGIGVVVQKDGETTTVASAQLFSAKA